jgi:hypothetical protein
MTLRQFTADELLDMRQAQVDHLLDTGLIQTRLQQEDSYGQSIETFTDGAPGACGLDMRPGSERRGTDLTVTTYDATLRLPITATPTVGDRYKITHRYGELLASPLVFEIVAPIQRGSSGIRLALRRIET